MINLTPRLITVAKQVSELVRAFYEQFVPAGIDRQVERAAQRFGLVRSPG